MYCRGTINYSSCRSRLTRPATRLTSSSFRKGSMNSLVTSQYCHCYLATTRQSTVDSVYHYLVKKTWAAKLSPHHAQVAFLRHWCDGFTFSCHKRVLLKCTIWLWRYKNGNVLRSLKGAPSLPNLWACFKVIVIVVWSFIADYFQRDHCFKCLCEYVFQLVLSEPVFNELECKFQKENKNGETGSNKSFNLQTSHFGLQI